MELLRGFQLWILRISMVMELLDIGVFEGGKHAQERVTFAWLESPEKPGTDTWIKYKLPQPVPLSPFIGAVKFGDIDQDGDPDLVVSMG